MLFCLLVIIMSFFLFVIVVILSIIIIYLLDEQHSLEIPMDIMEAFENVRNISSNAYDEIDLISDDYLKNVRNEIDKKKN